MKMHLLICWVISASSVVACKARNNRTGVKAVAANHEENNIALIAYDIGAGGAAASGMLANATNMDNLFNTSLKGQGFKAIKLNESGQHHISVENFRYGLNAAVSNLGDDATLFLHITCPGVSGYGLNIGKDLYTYRQLFDDIKAYRFPQTPLDKNVKRRPFRRLWLVLDVEYSTRVANATTSPSITPPSGKVAEIINAARKREDSERKDIDWSEWGFSEFVILPGADDAIAYTANGGEFTINLVNAFEKLARDPVASIYSLMHLTYGPDRQITGNTYNEKNGKILGYVSNKDMWRVPLWLQAPDDNDGVEAEFDLCPGTPERSPVNKSGPFRGCAAGETPGKWGNDDNDGVDPELDLCPNTPKGRPVWKSGPFCGCAYGEAPQRAPVIP